MSQEVDPPANVARGARPPAPEAPADAAKSGTTSGKLDLPEDGMILLCVRGMALFPGVVLPVSVGRERSILAVRKAVQEERPVGVVLQRDPDAPDPGADDVYRVGTVADIVRYITAPDGSHHIIAQGRQRFRIKQVLSTEPFMTGRVELIEEPPAAEQDSTDIEARAFNLRIQAREALQLLPQTPEDLDQAIQNAESPSLLADMVATFIELPPDEKQELLETLDLRERIDKVSERLAHVVEVLSLSRDIRQQTKGTLEKAQRDYYLREQLKTIQRELGEGASVELTELRQAIENARMPEEVDKVAHKELARLEKMPEAAAEYGMLRAYLDTLAELPWSVSTDDAIDIERAREILDADHYGLERVKRRIVEFLAVRKLKPDGKSPILCFVGPPGVGKTSLGQSIARAMNRKFVRVSLGGVHDESEIRGHRRTYVGALPGNVIHGLQRGGSNNPVFLFDEVDKLGAGGFNGDPSSALLEVLDPEQNRTFRDNYLAVPFDLSKVMFIGTANVVDGIPGPLRDRCEVIELAGYTAEEKLEIAKRYLVRRQLDNNGLRAAKCRISTAALREIITHYTLEAGCRNLEREIGAVLRHAATLFASGRRKKLVIEPEDVRRILGARRFESDLAQRTSVPGVATGLSWTPYGGHILFIEATRMPGAGELILTGQLGSVMKESARAAMSLVRSRAESLGIDPVLLEEQDVHIHVPAGAIPKDGPSAGVTMYTALVSLFTGRKVSSHLAMTGEISLRGHVLPIGGVKEKVIAAHRAGIRTVLLPSRNAKDLDDVPPSAREKLDFVFAENVDDVLEVAFDTTRRARPRKKRARQAGTSTPRAKRSKKK
jgi:ATP-dependent Lon protease